MIPSAIGAVFFDAVGTLIHPEPSAATVYEAAAQRHGSRLTADVIAARFRVAFARQEALDREAGWRTSEAREVERWRTIVREVLDDVADVASCFQELFAHFGRPHAWRVEADTARVLTELARRGLVLGLASNYDQRLRSVAAGFEELATMEHLAISSEVGWRKPAPAFFAALCQAVNLPPEKVLVVGDDLVNDFQGARGAALGAVLFDGKRRQVGVQPRICRLSELLD